MKLTDLEPEFIRWEDRVETTRVVPPEYVNDTAAWRAAGSPTVERTGPVTYSPKAETLADAQGVEFLCPKCANGHHIAVAFAGRGALDHHGSRDSGGRPTRWQVSGTGLGDLTLSPSVDCTASDPNCWHGFVTNGEIR